MVAPVISELAKDYQGKIVFGKLDVDENQKKAMEYGIMSIPALLVFQNSDLVDQIIGAQPRTTLEPKITKYLKEENNET
jgi:thioredoxin 1